MSIVPEDPAERRALEREANALLSGAHAERTADGRMRDNHGQRVISLNDEYGLDVEALWLVTNLDQVETLMIELAEGTTLTSSERVVCQAIAEGCPVPPAYGWADVVANLTGKSPANVRQTWKNARKKLIDEWANEPDERKRMRLRTAREGNGFNLIIGGEGSSSVPRIDPKEALFATLGHEVTKHLDRDWGYEPSLTDDGWQLGDDHLWS